MCSLAAACGWDVEKTVAFEAGISSTGKDGTATSGEVLDRMYQYAALGLDNAILVPPHNWDEESLDVMAALRPEITGIVPAGR
jgi:hypothetical protein